MNNYMRTMIYLKNKDNPKEAKGYLRLERKGECLLFSLVLTGENIIKNYGIYLIYMEENQEQRYCLVECQNGSLCEGRIFLSELPNSQLLNTIVAVLVGNEETYLVGSLNNTDSFPGWKKEEEKKVLHSQEEKEELQASFCREIDPSQLASINNKEWYLVANSFLLQGYYNYHHLLYLYDGTAYYIGVPGRYERKELYMAKRFGFPLFRNKQDKITAFGDFGYWLREVKKDE